MADIRPEDDTAWQSMVHGAPVHLLLSVSTPRVHLPLLLATLAAWRRDLPTDVSLLLALHDADGTISLHTVTTALGPGVGVVLTRGEQI